MLALALPRVLGASSAVPKPWLNGDVLEPARACGEISERRLWASVRELQMFYVSTNRAKSDLSRISARALYFFADCVACNS